MALSALQQLEQIERQFLGSGGSLVGEAVISSDEETGRDLSGRLRLAIRYPGGHLLHVAIVVDVTYGYPWWTQYSIQLRDQHGINVFRYDNAPHHRQLATFPDHKHVGTDERPEPHHLPDIDAVIEEVCSHVYADE